MLITKTQPLELREYSSLKPNIRPKSEEDLLVYDLDKCSPFKMIVEFTNTKLTTFTNQDIDDIEEVMAKYNLTPGVTNILIYQTWIGDPKSSLWDNAEYFSSNGIECTRDALHAMLKLGKSKK